MSSAVIIVIIIILLAALTCYALLAQSIEKKRKQKQRIVSALNARSKSFKHMLNGFPPDFLTKDLQVLVCRCLVDVLEQQTKIDPRNKTYVDELTYFSQQLETIKSKPSQGKRKQLQNPQQVKEVKGYLEDLNGFIAQMINRGTFTSTQGANYQKQVQRLVLQITVDAYLLNAKQSQTSNKKRLAIHYYTLAAKLLTKENSERSFTSQIEKLRQIITKLEHELTEEDPTYKESERSTASKEAAEKEWEELNQPEDVWKKKNIYD